MSAAVELFAAPACDLPDADGVEAADLTPDEAEAITSRIRRWANSFPVEDVVRAFRGRIWVALAYDSWAEWCECELGGLKLPVPQRREIVSELAGAGMSNRAIADTIGVGRDTVGRDLSTVADATVDDDAPRTTLGQDGRERSYPQPKPPAPEPEPEPEIVDAEIVEPPACDSREIQTVTKWLDATVINGRYVAEISQLQAPKSTAAEWRRQIKEVRRALAHLSRIIEQL
ncbi:hypothetical protein LAUMK4_05885 [Mycobacterium persicum]|uniref:Uncharacterized protein n=1 Tax=Mycobacterium persicum TaxID=1487726 RepID=A0ABY6RSM7_9MYCO|nr:hypothetical protein [Mycobacterium persicum]VBA33124.1 hypothetical protein LAUMK4_05885 [Mycobacterium persicum]